MTSMLMHQDCVRRCALVTPAAYLMSEQGDDELP